MPSRSSRATRSPSATDGSEIAIGWCGRPAYVSTEPLRRQPSRMKNSTFGSWMCATIVDPPARPGKRNRATHQRATEPVDPVRRQHRQPIPLPKAGFEFEEPHAARGDPVVAAEQTDDRRVVVMGVGVRPGEYLLLDDEHLVPDRMVLRDGSRGTGRLAGDQPNRRLRGCRHGHAGRIPICSTGSSGRMPEHAWHLAQPAVLAGSPRSVMWCSTRR